MRLTDLASICAGQPYLPLPKFFGYLFSRFFGLPQSLGASSMPIHIPGRGIAVLRPNHYIL